MSPYIKGSLRQELDPHIDAIIDILYPRGPQGKGMFNYIIYRLHKALFPPDYGSIADGIGTIVCSALEIYRRRMIEIEEEAIERNGDIK